MPSEELVPAGFPTGPFGRRNIEILAIHTAASDCLSPYAVEAPARWVLPWETLASGKWNTVS